MELHNLKQTDHYYRFNLPIGKLNTLIVRTNHPEEVRFVEFDTFVNNPYWEGVGYDIEMYQIEDALKKDKKFDLQEDWQDTVVDTEHVDVEHVDIIAKLVKIIPCNFITPLDFDTLSNSFSKFEGHHRLIALYYLNFGEDFLIPMCLSGHADFIETHLDPYYLPYKEISLQWK